MSSASETWEWVGRCDSCGGEFPTDATGRPRRYCSGACRQRAYRRRRGVATAAEAYRRGQGWALHLGDAAEVMRYIPAESVQTVVTSPPYYQLRDYRGHPDQLGMEPTVQEYIDRLVDVFREAARVLRPDGALWVNIGDTYSSRANRNPARHTGRGHRDGITAPRARSTDVAPVKSLLLVPSRLAIALQEDGWIIRNMGVWHKRNGTPESVTDRLARRHETLILATRRPRYYFDLDAIREPHAESTLRRARAGRAGPGRSSREGLPYEGIAASQTLRLEQAMHPLGKNPGDVWTLSTRPSTEDHYAMFPPEIPDRCVRASTRPGDVVLDPFAGRSTTGVAALGHGRQYLGIDINPIDHDAAARRLQEVSQ